MPKNALFVARFCYCTGQLRSRRSAQNCTGTQQKCLTHDNGGISNNSRQVKTFIDSCYKIFWQRVNVTQTRENAIEDNLGSNQKTTSPLIVPPLIL